MPHAGSQGFHPRAKEGEVETPTLVLLTLEMEALVRLTPPPPPCVSLMFFLLSSSCLVPNPVTERASKSRVRSPLPTLPPASGAHGFVYCPTTCDVCAGCPKPLLLWASPFP